MFIVIPDDPIMYLKVCTYLEIQMAENDPEGDEGGGELHEKGGGQQAVPFTAPAHIT
jgi:hypothetical protein